MDSLRRSDDEAAAVAKAPRVSLDALEARIANEEYIIPANSPTLTICVLTMKNGFSVVGHSAPAAAANFNAELGRKFARQDAVRQAWPLEGYLLREVLANDAAATDAAAERPAV